MEKSTSSEDYMKSILILHKRKGSVRSVDIAEEMGVSKPSVCNAMKKLRKQKMVYFGEEGRILAEKVYSKHSLLSKFLTLIGVNQENADREACLMEHAISDETYDCLAAFVHKQGAV